MAKSPAFQLYASDFLTDTSHMTAEELGIHMRLLCTQWINGSLINDVKVLSRISGCDMRVFKRSWPTVSQKYELVENGETAVEMKMSTLINKRLELTRKQQEVFREKQQKNGLKGGRPRNTKTQALTQIKPKSNPTHNPNKSSSTSVDTKVSTTVPIGHPYSHLPKGDARLEKYLTDPEYRREIDFRISNPL